MIGAVPGGQGRPHAPAGYAGPRGAALRVAFVGKGGAGKSALAGTFARLLARRGRPVLAVDSDPMPGLAWSLGLAPDDAGIPDEALSRSYPPGSDRPALRDGLDVSGAIALYTRVAPDGVRFLQFGKIHRGLTELGRSQQAFSVIRAGLGATGWDVVADLPGGTRQPFFGWAEAADVILVVVEPTAKSVLTARRLAALGATRPVRAVVNKVASTADAQAVAERAGLDLVGAVPWDADLAAAERRAAAPLDAAAASAAVGAVEALVERLLSGLDGGVPPRAPLPPEAVV